MSKSKITVERRAKIVTIYQNLNINLGPTENYRVVVVLQLSCQAPQLPDCRHLKLLEEQFKWDHLVLPVKSANKCNKFNKIYKLTMKRLTQLFVCPDLRRQIWTDKISTWELSLRTMLIDTWENSNRHMTLLIIWLVIHKWTVPFELEW